MTTTLPGASPVDQPVRPHPCQTDDCGFDHDWKFHDDSFDHEFGTERVHFWRCAVCEETREIEAGDYDY